MQSVCGMGLGLSPVRSRTPVATRDDGPGCRPVASEDALGTGLDSGES
jgi:hypothetical protein